MIFKSVLPEIEMPNVDFATFVLEEGKKRFGCPENKNTWALYDEECHKKLSIFELEAESKKFASGLVNKMGFRKGDILLIYATNSANFVVAILGTLMAGGTTTFANPSYTKREIANQIIDGKPRFVATQSNLLEIATGAIYESKFDIPITNIILLEHLTPPPKISHNQPIHIYSLYDTKPFDRFTINTSEEAESYVAFLPYSSGTTGLSKGVMLTHKNLVSNIIQTNIFAKLNGWHDDMSIPHRYFGVLPWYHLYGLMICLFTGLANGVGIVSYPKFEMKSFLQIVQKQKITVAHLVPPILINLVNDPIVDEYDITSIKYTTTAAAPIGKELMQKLSKKFSFMTIVKIYGLTESSPTITVAPKGNTEIESSGILTCNQEAKVIDSDGSGKALGVGEIGELLFRGPNIMKGYLNNEEATRNTLDSQGFLHTGDIGYFDKNGNLFVVDRKKELIKYKGFQVAPAELEALLLGNPDVSDVAVIGVYLDEQATEVPRAYVVLKPQHTNKSQSEKLQVATSIQMWVQANVAPHKRLRGGVKIIDSIPKSNAGKILRRVLRDMDNANEEASKLKAKI
ncbi:hypothetical protein BB558_003248 [Smittium angustum]|uniref:AMP-dependent synthetase/ligase domain-containing protein n=1 Tax=Smittium angustum TaxID=133377 RepID=A0A2U1J6J5_SMIAN|nr:hypothetical protein BB558_003248 [Smittium angustum]